MLAAADLLRGRVAVPHAFTPRRGGVSSGAFASLNVGASVGDDPAAVTENRRRVAAAFGVDPARILRLDQVHGVRVVVASATASGQEGDAWIGDDPTLTLAISAADCLPVALFDLRRGAVAAVHAGWRGVAAGVIPAAVAALAARYGSDPADLHAYLAPAIAGGCYQVGGEVVDAVLADPSVPASVARDDPSTPGRALLDLPAAATAQLRAAGLAAEAIEASGICTHCDAARCFSHRRDRGRSGRHWLLVAPLA
jgi:polyphenol oxidase